MVLIESFRLAHLIYLAVGTAPQERRPTCRGRELTSGFGAVFASSGSGITEYYALRTGQRM